MAFHSTANHELFGLKNKSQIKELGQFFTEQKVSDYMASMIYAVKGASLVRILDAGAGSGILTISAALRCLELGNNRIHAVLYEIDSNILPVLEIGMDWITREFNQKNAKFTYKVYNRDFILSRPDKMKQEFHISIINPPYYKYNSKDSQYSGSTADLFKGNPNIYASFMAIVSNCLLPNGQMVSIVPRSFTNGLYFKGFRNYLCNIMSLERIHIFRSRNRLFKNMGVLQENIICKFVKKMQSEEIKILSSTCSNDINESEINTYSHKLIIDESNDHNIIRIPENKADGHILKLVEKWPCNFKDNGYFISTGPVVEHRTRAFISTNNRKDSVPLLRMHNIKPFCSNWTGTHRKDAHFLLKDGHQKHTIRNVVYVLLKRFSSKDEKRRLVSGVHDPSKIKGDFIGLENHLNYIGVEGEEMQLSEAFGLSALFNSTIMDRYFRSISGNTQVNATEIRFIKLPTRKTITEIGKKMQKEKDIQQDKIDKIVNLALGV